MYELWWNFQFKTICKSFHCKKNFLLKICTYWCKETIDIIDVKKLLTFFAILIGSVIVLSSSIIADTLLTFFSAKYDSMYTLRYCFEVFFVQLKMMLFTLPCLFNYFIPVVFIWLMLDEVLLLIFLLLSSVYKVYLFSSLKFWCF